MMDPMTRILTLAALLFVSACNQQPSGSAPANEAAVANDSSVAEAEVPSLEGNWIVAAIDGKPVDASSAMTASFAGDKASIASGCVRRGATYTQKGNMVSFAADPGGSANCEGRGTSAEHESAYSALQGASIAIFGKEGNEANLSGSGGNLALRRR
jgi:heat shock protein HslJ